MGESQFQIRSGDACKAGKSSVQTILIVEWNEKNFNIKECPQYVIDAYHRKKWAFVTDYVRLRVVYEYGGIYFDTDVELVKKIDFLLKYSAFFWI